MADKRITELTEKTTLATGDLFVIVDSAGAAATKKIKAENAGFVDGELRLTPKETSSGPEGTAFYDSVDKCVYIGVDV